MAARVVVAFGRLNPPTMGHEYLVARLHQIARQEAGIPQLYLSHSYDPKTDPLHYAKKLQYCRSAFGDVVRNVGTHTIIDVMQDLERQGFLYVVYVAGQDRVREFADLLQQYNRKEYRFETIKVVSAGQRDPDAPGVTGMSASKLRLAAAANDIRLFVAGCPSKMPQVEKMRMFHDVRHGMGLKEGVTDRLEGTKSLTSIYQHDTPGEQDECRNVDEIFEIEPETLFTRVKRALASV